MKSIGAASIAIGTLAVLAGSANAAQPQYAIVDIGVLSGDSISQGFRVSNSGVAVGRSIGTTAHGFSWTQGGGIVSLPNLASPVRNFSVANGANDVGVVVGAASTNLNGTNRLPVFWQGGNVTQYALPSGQTLGDANDINNAGIAVGSVGSGSSQRAAIYQGGAGTMISATTSNGSFANTLFSINGSGLAVGTGIDPNNAARNVGFVYDTASNTAFDIGALPGKNGALLFDVSDAGHIVGTSMQNQGSGTPFIWTSGGGMVEIPLVTGASSAGARGVNSSGWVVGTGSGAKAIPYVYDGSNVYRIADLIPINSGWDLVNNTSSSAMSISDSGIIVGTGIFNGATHAYALVPVPAPSAVGLVGIGGLIAAARRRR